MLTTVPVALLTSPVALDAGFAVAVLLTGATTGWMDAGVNVAVLLTVATAG